MRYTLGSNLVVHNNDGQPVGAPASSPRVVLGARILAGMLALAAIILILRRKRAAAVSA
jgi:hypothetical protein